MVFCASLHVLGCPNLRKASPAVMFSTIQDIRYKFAQVVLDICFKSFEENLKFKKSTLVGLASHFSS